MKINSIYNNIVNKRLNVKGEKRERCNKKCAIKRKTIEDSDQPINSVEFLFQAGCLFRTKEFSRPYFTVFLYY